MEQKQVTLYIKAEELIETTAYKVNIGMLAQMECSNQHILNKVKSLQVIQFKEEEYKRKVVSILKVLEVIHQEFPNLQIVNLGACDMIIAYENQKTANKGLHLVKVSVVIIITFIGAAYSIMAFSNDVDTLEIFDLIYLLIMGYEPVGFTVLEASYSIGLVIGIVVFFNHFGKKKLTEDPTPMEIEMRLYEQDIQTTLVKDYTRNGVEVDVGQSSHTNHHRLK